MNTVKKESEPFDILVKNVKSLTTAKVSVLHRTNQQANVNILKANLGTLFLYLNFIKEHNRNKWLSKTSGLSPSQRFL